MISAAALVLSLATNPANAGSDINESDILWMDVDRTQPLFLPEPLLTRTEETLKSLKLPRWSEEAIRKAVSKAFAAVPPSEGCAQPPEGDVPGLEPGEQPDVSEAGLPRVLRSVKKLPLSVRGRVESLLPGWIVGREYVGTLVRLSVLEVLSDPRGELYEGKVVSYLQQSGNLEVGSRSFCTINPPYRRVQVGDVLLVIGSYENENPLNVGTGDGAAFPIANGLVFEPLRDRSASGPGVPLAEVRRLARKTERQQR